MGYSEWLSSALWRDFNMGAAICSRSCEFRYFESLSAWKGGCRFLLFRLLLRLLRQAVRPVYLSFPLFPNRAVSLLRGLDAISSLLSSPTIVILTGLDTDTFPFIHWSWPSCARLELNATSLSLVLNDTYLTPRTAYQQDALRYYCNKYSRGYCLVIRDTI